MTNARNRNALSALLLLAATFLIYSPSLRGTFLWDDDAHVSHNAALTTRSGLKDIWLNPGSVQQYYPVTYTAFWIQYHLWGLNPTGYHAVTLLLHGLNALLLWALLSALEIPGAWIAAWLFALHPIEAESVAWISELKNTLSAFFYLSAALCLVRGEKAKRSWKRPYGLAFILYTAAVLSKSVTVTLPLSFFIITSWMQGAWDRKAFVRLLPFLAVGLGIGGFTLHMEHDVIGALGKVCDYTFLQRVLLAGRCVWFYLGKLFYPAPLVFIYPRWEISSHDPMAYFYPVAVSALTGILVYGRRWWGKRPFAGFLFFILTLGPALGFTNFYPMRFSFVADHFQYLAGLGIFALAGWALSRLLEALQIPAPSAGGLVVMSFVGLNLALATFRESKKYMNSESLWQETLAYNPDSAIAHHNMGIALADQGQWNLAIAHLRTAEALDPSYPQTHLALAYFAAHARRWDDARHQYEEAIRLGIRDPQVLKDYSNLPVGQ